MPAIEHRPRIDRRPRAGWHMPLPASVLTPVRDLRRRYRETGLRATARRALRWLWLHVYLREPLIVMCKRLDDAAPPPSPALRLVPLEPGHLDALRALNAERGDRGGDARFAADLAAGYGGFAGLDDGLPVACYWWVDATMRPPHRDLRDGRFGIELGAGDAYGCDLYVREAFRGKGAAAGFLAQVEAALHDRGYERLWGYVVASNRPARWTYSVRGYEPIRTVMRTRVLHRWLRRATTIDEEGRV